MTALPFTPRLPPLPYQAAFLNEHGRDPAWGLIWDPGTGKSKALIDNAALLLCEDLIDGMLVIAPNGPHKGWAIGPEADPSELEKHWPHDTPVPYEAFVWDTYKAGGKRYMEEWYSFLARIRRPDNPDGPFGILCMSYDSLMTDLGKKASWDFLRKRRVFYVADESQRFKEPSSKRNIRIFASSAYAPFKRIASGTPGDKPFDLYPQMRFLDEDFWKRTMGIDSVTAFRYHLGNWHKVTLNTGVKFDALDQKNPYKNLAELEGVLATMTTRLTEEEAELNLPPPIPKRIYHDLTLEQQQAWRELKEECLTILSDGRMVTAEHVLTLRLRLMQIGCGFITPSAGEEPVPFAQNPRAEAVRGVLQVLPEGEPTIGWGLFTHDCQTLAAVSRSLGRRPVIFDAANTEGTVDAWKRGQYDDLIGQLNSGLVEFYTLNRACHMLYYSNSPRLIARQQSERRCRRIGQTRPVTYYDFLARGTNDEANLEAVRVKARWMGMSMGEDPQRAAAWLRATLMDDPYAAKSEAQAMSLDAFREEYMSDWMSGDEYEATLRNLG